MVILKCFKLKGQWLPLNLSRYHAFNIKERLSTGLGVYFANLREKTLRLKIAKKDIHLNRRLSQCAVTHDFNRLCFPTLKHNMGTVVLI